MVNPFPAPLFFKVRLR